MVGGFEGGKWTEKMETDKRDRSEEAEKSRSAEN